MNARVVPAGPDRVELPDGEALELAAWLRAGSAPEAGRVDLQGLRLHYVRPRAFALAVELIFGVGVYDVDLPASPRIVDGGAWLGLSLLRFHRRHPGAVIVGFEPDPRIRALCLRNLEANDAGDITVVEAALSDREGTAAFAATGSDNGSLLASVRHASPLDVRTLDASRAVPVPLELLKLNVEGAEWPVIRALGPRLRDIEATLIEYHGFAELPQTLHEILSRLHEAGHRYVLSHFDERNAACVPPLRVTGDLRYFQLIHSRQLDGPGGASGILQ